jgi:hypothetical protein
LKKVILDNLRPRHRSFRTNRQAVQALIGVLRGGDAFAAMWAAAVFGRMGKHAHEAIPFLVEALLHEEEKVRELAAKALHELGENSICIKRRRPFESPPQSRLPGQQGH